MISALCFALFIIDLPNGISSRVLLYADDAKLLRKIASASDSETLQRDLDKLCQWSEAWKLTLNATKCKSFTISLRRKQIVVSYLIAITKLEHVGQIRALSVTMDNKLID